MDDWRDSWIHGLMYVCMEASMAGWLDRWMDVFGWVGGSGWMDKLVIWWMEE